MYYERWWRSNGKAIPTPWRYDCCVSSLLPKSKTQHVHFRLHTNYFLYIGRFLKKSTDDQWSLITNGRIYHIKPIQPFYYGMGVGWYKIGCLWKYLLYLLFAHTAFLLFLVIFFSNRSGNKHWTPPKNIYISITTTTKRTYDLFVAKNIIRIQEICPLCKNAVSVFQISCKLPSFFTLKDSWKISRLSVLFHN